MIDLMKRLSDFDGSDARKRANEDGGARNGWSCKAIRLSYIQRCDDLPCVHIERIDHPIGETVYRLTSYDR